MQMKKNTIAIIVLLLAFNIAAAQETLSLDTCRARALRANLGIRQAELKVKETDALEKVALMQMLPKVSANGGYLWMEKNINLLSEEQKERLNHLGDNAEAEMGQSVHNRLDNVPFVGESLANEIEQLLANSDLPGQLNNIGQEVVQSLETDTRNMGGGMVMLTQPVYTGGKLTSLHRSAQLMNHLAGVELDKKQQETLLAVDEAYWLVVSVQYKHKLAEEYAALMDTMVQNVQTLVDAEMATRGDLAQVRVKQGEAQMSLTRATNSLRLAKMLLAERCGMPLDSPIAVEQNPSGLASSYNPNTILTLVWDRRPEIRMLAISDSLALEGIRLAASTLKPNVALSGGYLLTNPNVFDGFRNEWGGTWMAGVVVNVPLVHPAGFFAIKAAKAKRQEVALQREEAQRLINLQVERLHCELEVACKHLIEAEDNLKAAEENLRLANESFKAGMSGSSDLLAAQTAWQKAESEVIDAHIDIEMNKVYLKQALGI